MTYTLYIDESGDVGIQPRQIKNGASPLFFLGGYLIHEDKKQALLNLITECRNELNNKKIIHFSSLKHHQKIFFCRKLSQLPIKIFGLISDKSELDRGNYRNLIAGDSDKFYNKNVKYFLETICKYCLENELEISRIVFEKQEGKDYDRLKNYIRFIQNKPFNSRARYLGHITAGIIQALSKEEEPLLQVSDAVAHSFYRLCTPDRYDICDHNYLEEIKNLIPSKLDNLTLGVGIKIVPNLHSLRIKNSVKEYLKILNSQPIIRY